MQGVRIVPKIRVRGHLNFSTIIKERLSRSRRIVSKKEMATKYVIRGIHNRFKKNHFIKLGQIGRERNITIIINTCISFKEPVISKGFVQM